MNKIRKMQTAAGGGLVYDDGKIQNGQIIIIGLNCHSQIK